MSGRFSYVLWLLLGAAALQAQSFDCATCHSQPQEIAASPHAALGCATCHGEIRAYPHPKDVAKPECSQCHATPVDAIARGKHAEILPGVAGCSLCHGGVHQVADTKTAAFQHAVPQTCGACHDQPGTDFAASVHGAAVEHGIAEAPVCSTCHRGHDVQRLSAVAADGRPGVIETCGSCHADVRLTQRFGMPNQVVASFETSFHGLALKGGFQTVASCASCHGSHKILPASNSESMIAPRNLAMTCGQCHAGAGSRFAIGQMHVVEGRGEPAPVTWVRVTYQILIPMVVGFMLLHCLGDWIRKVLVLRFAPVAKIEAARRAPRDAAHFRMYRMERIQHGLLILSFTVLVWSGFALRYSTQWWAQPLIAWEEGGLLRGEVHRAAGAVLIAVGLLHAITLIVRPELRAHWKSLLPKWADVKEAFARLAYNIGLRKTQPPISSHSYVEKLEYWAVVWGTGIMALTGLMLWANTLMLAWAPKVALDIAATVHFYEAVLATLSIIVWHFYVVIFDPEVYPVDPAWLTGYSVRDRDK